MRDSVLDRTIQDPALSMLFPDSRFYLSVFQHYASLHVLDNKNTLRYLKSIPLKGINAVDADEFQLNNWLEAGLQSSLVVSTGHITLVPAGLYSADVKQAYAELNFGKLTGYEIVENYLPQANAYLLFPVLSTWLTTYKTHASIETTYHIATPWLASLLVQFRNTNDPVLAFDIEDPLLRIAVINEGNLRFFNTFSISNTDDLLYYLVNVARETGMDLHKQPVYASGLLFQHSERFKQLYRYIRYIRFLQRVSSLSYTQYLDSVPEHLFYNILGLPLCES